MSTVGLSRSKVGGTQAHTARWSSFFSVTLVARGASGVKRRATSLLIASSIRPGAAGVGAGVPGGSGMSPVPCSPAARRHVTHRRASEWAGWGTSGAAAGWPTGSVTRGRIGSRVPSRELLLDVLELPRLGLLQLPLEERDVLLQRLPHGESQVAQLLLGDPGLRRVHGPNGTRRALGVRDVDEREFE